MTTGSLLLLPVGKRQELVDRLAAGVAPAALVVGPSTRSASSRNGTSCSCRRPRRSRRQHRLLLLVGVLQDDLGAVHVGLDRADRLSTISFTPTAAARWKTTSARSISSASSGSLIDAVDGVVEAGAVLEVRDVVDRPGREVVEHVDLVPVVEQSIRQMGADEPGAAGDEHSHVRGCRLTARPAAGQAPS